MPLQVALAVLIRLVGLRSSFMAFRITFRFAFRITFRVAFRITLRETEGG